MRRSVLVRVKELLETVERRLQNAELRLSAALSRLSALDSEIARLCIERAQTPAASDIAFDFGAIELKRRMAAALIEELRLSRAGAEADCDRLREEIRLLLQRKLTLETKIEDLIRDDRRKARRA